MQQTNLDTLLPGSNLLRRKLLQLFNYIVSYYRFLNADPEVVRKIMNKPKANLRNLRKL
jgi:hypothetical protein